MAKFVLSNSVQVTTSSGTTLLQPGKVIDDSLYDVVELVSAGAILLPLLDVAADVEARVVARKLKGWGQTADAAPFPDVIVEAAAIAATQEIYVSKGGSDVAGLGTALSPFLTIAHALSTIADNSIDKNYAIYVGPGEYADPWGLKPWVGIIGAASPSNGARPDGATLTTITAPTNTIGFDSTWTAASGFGVGFMNFLGFVNHQTWDQATRPGILPQINAQSCSFNAGASFLGPGNVGFDNVSLIDCISYGGYVVQGWQFLWLRSCTTIGGSILVQAGGATATESTTLLAQFSQLGNVLGTTPITVKWASPTPVGVSAIVQLDNTSNAGTITLDGVHTKFSESSSSTGVIDFVHGANNYVGHVLGEHVTINGEAPALVAGSSAGHGATASFVGQATDNAGIISLATGTGPDPTTGPQAVVTYEDPYPSGAVPIVVISRGDANVTGQFYVTSSDNLGFTIAASVAPSPSQTYVLPYVALGTLAP